MGGNFFCALYSFKAWWIKQKVLPHRTLFGSRYHQSDISWFSARIGRAVVSELRCMFKTCFIRGGCGKEFIRLVPAWKSVGRYRLVAMYQHSPDAGMLDSARGFVSFYMIRGLRYSGAAQSFFAEWVEINWLYARWFRCRVRLAKEIGILKSTSKCQRF